MCMSHLNEFRRETSGSASVEIVLWLAPIFFLFLIATDATLAFMRQSQMWQVSRETARIVSRYGMDEITAETFAAEKAAIGSFRPTVNVSFAQAEVTVEMSMPAEIMTPFGTLGFVMSDAIETRVVHAMEPL